MQRAHHNSVNDENEGKATRKKESKIREKRPKARHTLGEFGKWLLLLLVFLVQHWLSVSAAAGGPQRKTEAVMRMQQEIADQRKQMDGGSPKEVEAAERGGQNGNEERSKKIEVHLAQWIRTEHREN